MNAQIFVCIAYEILMWIWIERKRADHKQMGESQAKSENEIFTILSCFEAVNELNSPCLQH